MTAPSATAAPQPRFPLPRRHRRWLASAAVVASLALGGLGVAATAETVRHQQHAATAAAAGR
ncbi:hypothetical protein [Kitasatospora sp. NBC_01539]|uniref:hypothetical protein n=1 Tax=Kitasatospora sp. NBC_01539 TaxID=2903577 RepID=UPI0038601C1B